MTVNEVGALCFGITTGYITYRTLVRTTEKTSISDLAAVLAAIGGAAVTKIYDPGKSLFGWYAIGLLAGMVVYFLVYLRIRGKADTGRVMFGPTRTEGAVVDTGQPRGGGPRP